MIFLPGLLVATPNTSTNSDVKNTNCYTKLSKLSEYCLGRYPFRISYSQCGWNLADYLSDQHCKFNHLYKKNSAVEKHRMIVPHWNAPRCRHWESSVWYGWKSSKESWWRHSKLLLWGFTGMTTSRQLASTRGGGAYFIWYDDLR